MRTSKNRDAGAAALLVAASFLVVHLVFFLLPRTFGPFNSRLFDELFVLRQHMDSFRPTYDGTVVHLDITDSSLQRLKTRYLNRTHFARLTECLTSAEVAAQAYDFIFASEMNPAEDTAFVDAVSKSGSAYFGEAFSLKNAEGGGAKLGRTLDGLGVRPDGRWTIPAGEASKAYLSGECVLATFPRLTAAARGTGFLNVIQDEDGVFRRAPLFIEEGGLLYPSFPLRVVLDVLHVSPADVAVLPGRVVLRGARFPGGGTRDVDIPVDSRGCMLVNFAGPWERMKHYGFSDLYEAASDPLELDVWRDELKGKIAVVSDISTGATDLGPTPLDANLPLGSLHANVIDTILSGRFLREVDGWPVVPVELVLTAITVFLAVRASSVVYVFGSFGLAAVFSLCVAAAFLTRGVVFQAATPLAALTVSGISVLAWRFVGEEKRKEALRRSFESYFPPQVVRKIMANPDSIWDKGERKELSILFSDIRSFTTHSAKLPPDRIRKFLNEYFEAMVEIVFQHRGTVDKFIGDGLMVFFGDPEPLPDHATRAVRAALEMQRKARELDAAWKERGEGIPLEIRIGVNTGEVVVGNMGSSRHLSYTVLGADVNLAQRLESNAHPGGILISRRTRELLDPGVKSRYRGEITVKGIVEPIPVHDVVVDDLAIS